MGEHRDDTATHKSLEEEILEKIDAAASSAEEPAKEAVKAANTAKRLTVLLVVFASVFAFAVSFGLVRTQQALNRIEEVAEKNRQYVLAGCVSGNESRFNEYQLLFGIIKRAYGKNLTVENQMRLDAINKQMQETYPQLDCSKVEDGERVVIPYPK